MNQDPAKIKWDQMKECAKKVCDGLTENDFRKAEGAEYKFDDDIQKTFDETKKSLMTKLYKLRQK